VFGSAGIFSPAFWVAPTLQKDIAVYANGYQGKLFFYAGAKESASMVPQMDQVMDAFKKAAKADLKRLVDDEGQHNEQSWQQHFIDYIGFIL
jgi:metallo-beta-lactamase class B